jgi:hypothetical protein
MTAAVKVRVGADIASLIRYYFIDCEPPYFYGRCRSCDKREFLPWDARLRTQEAHELLLQHGKECGAGVDDGNTP